MEPTVAKRKNVPALEGSRACGMEPTETKRNNAPALAGSRACGINPVGVGAVLKALLSAVPRGGAAATHGRPLWGLRIVVRVWADNLLHLLDTIAFPRLRGELHDLAFH